MPLKIFPKKWLAKVSIILVGIFALAVIGFFQPKSAWSSTANKTPKAVAVIASSSPVRLKIARLKINASIESVGLTPQGAVGVPNGENNVSWFNLGTLPGEVGSAVISGHFGYWKNGKAAIFNSLAKLKPGDKISVQNQKGTIVNFVVRTSKSYDQNAQATEVFSSTDGGAHLNLITCGGTWNRKTKSYPQRLVIFADLAVN